MRDVILKSANPSILYLYIFNAGAIVLIFNSQFSIFNYIRKADTYCILVRIQALAGCHGLDYGTE